MLFILFLAQLFKFCKFHVEWNFSIKETFWCILVLNLSNQNFNKNMMLLVWIELFWRIVRQNCPSNVLFISISLQPLKTALRIPFHNATVI